MSFEIPSSVATFGLDVMTGRNTSIGTRIFISFDSGKAT